MASKDVIDTLIAEAGGEGDAGLIAAAWAIQQRAAARGQTVDQVIKSGFDGYSNPGSGAVKAQQDPRLRAKVEQIMTGVQNGSIPNPVPGADHFLSGDANPSWVKGMKPVATIGGHRFYASGNVPQEAYGPLIPPGELPEVASALATVPTPRNAPVPVTPSVDLAQYRKNVAPSQLGPETFAALNRPKRNLGDEIGMSPISGGKQQAPLFDAGFDTRTNEMRLFSNGPADTQGVFTWASKAPAPVPRMPSPQLAGRRATDPVLQAALNAKYHAQPPPLPSPVGQSPSTRVVQSIPVRGGPSNLDVARNEQAAQRSAAPPQSRPPAVPQQMTVEQMYAGIYPTEPGQFRIGSSDGLGPGNPYGTISTAALTGEVGPNGLPVTAPLKMPPIPFQRPAPTQFAAAPRIAPVPFMRPTGVGTQLAVRPMPPMPIARPGIGGPAPRPGPFGIKMPAAPPLVIPPGRTVTSAMLPIMHRQQLAQNAVSQSGDTSVGSQADAAAARSSGEGGRNRRY